MSVADGQYEHVMDRLDALQEKNKELIKALDSVIDAIKVEQMELRFCKVMQEIKEALS